MCIIVLVNKRCAKKKSTTLLLSSLVTNSIDCKLLVATTIWMGFNTYYSTIPKWVKVLGLKPHVSLLNIP